MTSKRLRAELPRLFARIATLVIASTAFVWTEFALANTLTYDAVHSPVSRGLLADALHSNLKDERSRIADLVAYWSPPKPKRRR